MLTKDLLVFFYLALSLVFLILIFYLKPKIFNRYFSNYSQKSVRNKIVISGMFRDSFLSLSPRDKFKSIDMICKTDFDYIRIHYISKGLLLKYDVYDDETTRTDYRHETNKIYPQKDEVHIYLKYFKI